MKHAGSHTVCENSINSDPLLVTLLDIVIISVYCRAVNLNCKLLIQTLLIHVRMDVRTS